MAERCLILNYTSYLYIFLDNELTVSVSNGFLVFLVLATLSYICMDAREQIYKPCIYRDTFNIFQKEIFISNSH